MGPLAIGAIGLGANILGDLFGGSDEGIPDWAIDMLKKEVQRDRTTGFLPDESLWTKATQSSIDKILATLPSGMERFNTDLASRGIYSSGEAPKYLYSDVVAPVMREAGGALVHGRLGYSEMVRQTKMQAEQQRMQYMSMLINAVANKGKTPFQNIAGTIGELGGTALTMGLYGYGAEEGREWW